MSEQKILRKYNGTVCLFCNKTCSNKDYLKQHINYHTKERPYQCTQCDASFSFNSGLFVHRIRLHGPSGNLRNNSLETKVSKASCKKLKRVRFNLKRNEIRKIPEFKRKKPANAKVLICNKLNVTRETKRNASSGKTSFGKNATTCIFCDKLFRRRHIFENHMTTHTKERPYNCFSCDKNFGFHAALYQHTKTGIHKTGRHFSHDMKHPVDLRARNYNTNRNEQDKFITNRFNPNIQDIKLYKACIKLERVRMPASLEEKPMTENFIEIKMEKDVQESSNYLPEATICTQEKSVRENEVTNGNSMKTAISNIIARGNIFDIANRTNSPLLPVNLHRTEASTYASSSSNTSTLEVYPCIFCQTKFYKKRHLKKHLGSNHRLSMAVARTVGMDYRGRNLSYV